MLIYLDVTYSLNCHCVIVFYYFLKGGYATFELNISNSGFENIAITIKSLFHESIIHCEKVYNVLFTMVIPHRI